MKKSQGMPINIVLIGAAALITLVILVSGFFMGFGGAGEKLSELVSGSQAGQSDIEAYRVKCQSYCRELDGMLSKPIDASSYNFCTKTFLTDNHCYRDSAITDDDELVVSCSVTLVSGSSRQITENCCSLGSEALCP